MSAISKRTDVTGVTAAGSSPLVRDIMGELFQPGWFWALREMITGEVFQEDALPEPDVDSDEAVGQVIREIINMHTARTGLALRDVEIENVVLDFKATLFHPAFIPAVRALCNKIMAGELQTAPLNDDPQTPRPSA
jgi:hypothetical protein